MTHVPTTGPGDVVVGHRLFRAALAALAHPDRPQPVPPPAQGPHLAADLFAAIWESSTPVFSGAVPPLGGTQATASQASLLNLDHDDAASLSKAHVGTELAPETAATVLLRAGGPGTQVILTGPGVDSSLRTLFPMDPEVLRTRNQLCQHPPLGVDLLVVSGTQITGLPRTTVIEVRG